VARPFRFHPPSPPDHSIARDRLLTLLEQRWDRRLVAISAGPGFGKTALLSAAVADDRNRRGTDVWLTCEPADESSAHLAVGLAEALGVHGAAEIGVICDAVWSRAPEVVCLVLDDVHEVPAQSKGAQLLTTLLSDLPRNGRVVLASRAAPPVPTARLAAAGQLLRIDEEALSFDTDELLDFADQRKVAMELLASAGGWPALAELTASAGSDLVLDYLWEEVLDRLGAERVQWLARFAAVGGGDDEVATAIAGRPLRVADLVASVPLVKRAQGWAALHPMWEPALRDVIPDAAADEARIKAAAVHRRNRRFGEAIELSALAREWDDVMATLREVELIPWMPVLPTELERWRQLVPADHRGRPEILLATAMHLEARNAGEAPAAYQAAASAFAARGDIDGELIAIAHHGLVRWWSGDIAGLFSLYERLQELAAQGSANALALNAICLAAIAHLEGDSAGVHQHLRAFDDGTLVMWRPQAQWLRSVAYRRDGDLINARKALDDVGAPTGRSDLQLELARLRTDWLDGDVDRVRSRLAELAQDYESTGERVLAREAILELACKTAQFGETDTTQQLLARAACLTLDEVPPLHDVLRNIADATLAVAENDEARAEAILEPHAATIGTGPTSWYWRDRTAIALTYLLLPATRADWTSQTLGPPHQQELTLTRALATARDGDSAAMRTLQWPAVGMLRAHMPARWIAELVAFGNAAGNPAPDNVIESVGSPARAALRVLAERPASVPLANAAKRLLSALPPRSGFVLRIDVLGRLSLRRDDQPVVHDDLRRQRVRELLCYLVAHRSERREVICADVWPDVDSGAHNLRVTLNYLQHVLQPGRDDGERPYFLRAEGNALVLCAVPELEVDFWELQALLEAAQQAERDEAPAVALAFYRRLLPLWKGEPFTDVPYSEWVQPIRAKTQRRYVDAVLRGGELMLAANDLGAALDAASRAVDADKYSEAAHQLAIRAHLAQGDGGGAHRAYEQCRAALAELDLSPQPATARLLSHQS
jgi:LuxR family maltose regulon positive regulatory protein